MKRILLSVFAAAITAAWVAPSMAADVTLSGQYRLRGEYRSNPTFAADEPSQTFYGQRVRLTANAKATDDTSVKITLQDTRTWGATDRTTDNGDNTIDLHESYLNVDKLLGTPVTLKVGRQELVYGDQRLLGAINWSNNGQSFDALKVIYGQEMFNLDVFTAKLVENTTGSDDTDLYGAYATLKNIPNNTLDLYVLNERNNATGMNIYAIGARLKGAVAGVDYSLEVPFETGENSATVDRSGFAFAGTVSYLIPNTPKLRVGAEVDYGSGDDGSDPASDDSFYGFYPTNHDKFGYSDVVTSWSNLTAFSLNASAEPNDKLKVYGAYWSFTKTESAAGADDSIGSEIDLTATYKVNSAVTAELGYARFFVGDATAVNGEDQDWAYLMLTANF
jgi:hypothetical protein